MRRGRLGENEWSQEYKEWFLNVLKSGSGGIEKQQSIFAKKEYNLCKPLMQGAFCYTSSRCHTEKYMKKQAFCCGEDN